MKFLNGDLKKGIESLSFNDKEKLEEIRLKVNKPVIIHIGNCEYYLTATGKTTYKEMAIVFSQEMLDHTLNLCLEYSLFLKEEEIKQGFITTKDGCRVGVCGEVIYNGNQISSIRNISSLNIRVPHEIKGCASPLMHHIVSGTKVFNSLIVAPPREGKTTVLRDVARQLSDFHYLNVVVIDERKELYGNGDFELGDRTDVLSGCKKSQGIMMAIRTMSPRVIIVDEIGDEEDFKAISTATNCGVSVVATLHGDSLKDASLRVKDVFDSYILLNHENYNFRNKLAV